MRSLWSGAISFGLINIPIKMYAATERQNVKFNYLHEKCHTPVKYEKKCPTCQRAITQDEIVRGYEYTKGQYVIVTEEDFGGIEVEATKTIDLIDFLDLDEIDPVYFDKTYYLEAAKTGTKAYQLLKQALEATQKIAIAKVVIRSKQALAAIRVYDQLLAMETMFFPAEIRAGTELIVGADAKITEQELDMAIKLINSLTVPFEPEKYTNDYQAQLLGLIEQKVSGKEVVVVPEQPVQGQVADLMTALEASI